MCGEKGTVVQVVIGALGAVTHKLVEWLQQIFRDNNRGAGPACEEQLGYPAEFTTGVFDFAIKRLDLKTHS